MCCNELTSIFQSVGIRDHATDRLTAAQREEDSVIATPLPSYETGAPRESVGTFTSPRTGEEVHVIARRGESPADAMARVQSHHVK